MKTSQEVWLSVCEDKFPGKTQEEIMRYFYSAATDWSLGPTDTPLAQLFDQYLVIKKLTGIL
jgi:hypothetical protein